MKTITRHLTDAQHINDFPNDVAKFIHDNRKVLVVAPPKSGKSSFFARYAKLPQINGIIIVPFNSLLTTYEHYGIEAIRSGFNTPDVLDKNKPYVMVWNQAVSKKSHSYMEQIRDRILIFDETHLLMMHKTFRDDIVPLLDELIENAKVAVLTTATECCEAEIWNLPKMEFTRETSEKERIDIEWYQNAQPKQSMELMVDCAFGRFEKFKRMPQNRKVVVFTNRYAQELFDAFKACALCRADNGKYKSNSEGQQTIEKEMLVSPLTIVTDFGKFGINLRNPEDDIIAIVDMEYGECTSIDLIQAIGRLREFRSLQVLVIHSAPKGKKRTSQQKFINSQAVKRSVSAPPIFSDRQKRMFALLDEFISAHTSYGDVKRDVEAFNDGQYKIVKGGGKLKEMAGEFRMAEEYWFRREYMTQGSMPEFMSPRACCWLDDIQALEAKDIPFKKFLSLYCEKPTDKPSEKTPIKYTPLPKIIEYISDVKTIMEMSKNQWDIYKQEEEENIRNVIAKGADEGTVRKVRLELEYKKRIRDEWIEKRCRNAEDRWECLLNAEREFRMENLVYAGKRKKEGNSKGGSKSRRNTVVSVVEKATGKIMKFDSVTECCKALHCTKPTFKRFKNGLSELNVKYEFVSEG